MHYEIRRVIDKMDRSGRKVAYIRVEMRWKCGCIFIHPSSPLSIVTCESRNVCELVRHYRNARIIGITG